MKKTELNFFILNDTVSAANEGMRPLERLRCGCKDGIKMGHKE